MGHWRSRHGHPIHTGNVKLPPPISAGHARFSTQPTLPAWCGTATSGIPDWLGCANACPGDCTVNGGEDRSTVSAERRLAEQHFADVATRYRSLRNTDHEPVRHIRDRLPDGRLLGLDVAAGTGNYTQLLVQHLAGRASILAADLSLPMLRVLRQHAGPGELAVVCCEAERLPIDSGAVDFVTTFNAVHHFDLDRFVNEVARVLTANGQLFVYTRTPQQNARSIWGRSFPGFSARETRLHDQATIRRALNCLGAMDVSSFSYTRRATPAQLAERVRGRAYSTFALYQPDDLDEALDRFLQTIDGCDEVCWQDHNLLIHVHRTH
jgi:ubiquinone/menaquinone biosynthesis C-methylase UbiE